MNDQETLNEETELMDGPAEGRTSSSHPVRAINLSGDTVTIKTAEYPEEQRDLLRWVFGHAHEQRWSWKDCEANTHVSTTTLYRIWTGSYRYPKGNAKEGELIPLNGVCERLERFRALALERAASRRVPFIETGVFKRVLHACREALVMQTFAMIYGESQIGKTAALKEIQRRNPGNMVYVLMPASAGWQGLLTAIGEACHISARTSCSVLRKRVWDFFDDSKLLIIDEVHEIFVSCYRPSRLRCLSSLRQLQEESGCGMVLCGTNVFRHELELGEYAQSLKQLRKRGIWEVQLESVPTAKDLELIAGHYRLGAPTGDAAELVKWIATEFGLGKYTKFLARASQLATKKGERFAWRHFVDVVAVANRLKEQSR